MFAESGNTLLDVCIFLLRVSNLTTNIRVFAFSEASLYSNSYWHYAIRFSQIMNNDLRQPCSITFLDVSWRLTSQCMIRKIYTCSDIIRIWLSLSVLSKRYTLNYCFFRHFISFPYKISFSYTTNYQFITDVHRGARSLFCGGIQ